jgi:hypothetical protein
MQNSLPYVRDDSYSGSRYYTNSFGLNYKSIWYNKKEIKKAMQFMHHFLSLNYQSISFSNCPLPIAY